MSNNLFIIDKQDDRILSHINKKHVIFNEHEQDLPTYRDMFRFTTLGDKRYSQYLMGRNGLIVPGEDGELLEFRIFESIKYRDSEGLKVEVYSLATFLDLKNAKIIEPHSTSSESAEWHARQALAGMEWQVGRVDFKGVRSITFDNYTNPYDYLKRIAREFDLELRFYITHDGQKVTGRYVDLIERVGEWRGRTVEFGRDLQGIRRIEQTDQIVTALLGVGPEREDGTRLEVFVEDKEALERWGRNGQHIVDVYEPMSERSDMTKEELEQYTRTELNKRINAVVSYEADILDLENVPGLENKKIRFGDTIRIKDLKFNPALYVEARVHNQVRDVFNKDSKRVILGDYQEFTEDEVKAIFNQLREQIKRKISLAEVVEVAELKIHRDSYPPEDTNRLWLDMSKETPILKEFDVQKQEWVEVGGGSAVVTDDSFPDTVPPVPTNLKADGLFKIIKLSWDYDPSSYIAAYEVYASQVQEFTPDSSNLVWRGKSGGYNHEADVNQKWYFRVRAINTHGTASDFSDEIEGATVRINAQTDIQPLTITNELIAENAAIDFAKIANVEITNAMIDYIEANKIRGGSFEGQTFTGGKFKGAEFDGGLFKSREDRADGTYTELIIHDSEFRISHQNPDTSYISTLSISPYRFNAYGTRLPYQYVFEIPDSRFAGDLTVNNFYGNRAELNGLDVKTNGPGIRMLGTFGYIEVRNATGSTRYGFIGKGNSTTNDMHFYAEHGNLRLNASGRIYAETNLNVTGDMTASGRVIVGDSLIRSNSGSTFNIGADNFARIVASGGFVNNDSFRPLYASEFNPVSTADSKNNIEVWEGSALDIVKDTTVYQYYRNFDNEHLRYGFVIGEGYQTPKELLAPNGEAIDLYKSVGVLFKAVQELEAKLSE